MFVCLPQGRCSLNLELIQCRKKTIKRPIIITLFFTRFAPFANNIINDTSIFLFINYFWFLNAISRNKESIFHHCRMIIKKNLWKFKTAEN